MAGEVTMSDAQDDIFSQTELMILKMVSDRFKGLSTKKIVDLSHEEPAWMDNVDDFHRISFEYACYLKNTV